KESIEGRNRHNRRYGTGNRSAAWLRRHQSLRCERRVVRVEARDPQEGEISLIAPEETSRCRPNNPAAVFPGAPPRSSSPKATARKPRAASPRPSTVTRRR